MGNRQRRALLTILAALSLPAHADRGSGAYNQGVRAQKAAKFDEAFGYFKQAYTLTPNNPKYVAAYTRMRLSVSSQHIHAGQLLRNTGNLTEAMSEFQRAAEVDSTSFMAQQELRRTADMIHRQEREKSAPKVPSPLEKRAQEVGEGVELKPLSNAPISLRLTANADVAYKTICKLAGINVFIDPDYRPQKLTLELTDVTLNEALEIVRLQSKTFWRPISANTIFVAQDSAAKRKDLESNVMKTFYLQNVTTPNELQEAANVVRQMLDVNRVQLLQGQDALVVRGTMDQMVLVQKLLANIDKPKAEVVIDVAVMQVSRDRIRTLGTVVPTSASIGYVGGNSGGLTTSGSSTSGTGTTGTSGTSGTSGTGVTGNGSGGVTAVVGNFAMSVSGGSFSFLASDSNTKLLQNPEIRAVNNEKATLRIGDRVPIATGSFQPGLVGGAGVSPLVSTQFQYLDVGVNIDITPHIHSNNEVTLKMSLEISSVTGQQSIGGITQPIIGQRRIDHETRLADGDVNLLGGILEDQETQSLSGYPWISRLPLLKYLFAQENKERRENEIVFAITPHIIRSRDVTEDDLRVVEVGTGSLTELRRKPSAPAATATEPADAAKQQATPQRTPPTVPVPVSQRPTNSPAQAASSQVRPPAQ
jgi:general secretion pathway protein D